MVIKTVRNSIAQVPLRFSVGIEDPVYLESLRFKNIRVVNFAPTIQNRDLSLEDFLATYIQRQDGIIKRVSKLGEYIARKRLLLPSDIDGESKVFFRAFLDDMDNFLANSYSLTLTAKKIQETVYKQLAVKYPEIKDLILIPSCGIIDTFKLLREHEFINGENEIYVHQFCGGNYGLAQKTAVKIDKTIYKRLKTRFNLIAHEKFYAALERQDVKDLDTLLMVDHFVEAWIWKASWFTAPMWHAYNIIQEYIRPTGKLDYQSFLEVIRLI
jgi:hypothetical protein